MKRSRPAVRLVRSLAVKAGSGRLLATALLIGMAVLRVADPAPVEALRTRIFDFYQRLQPRAVSSHPVVVADIDERSLHIFGQWPWPRTRIAQLVERLKAANVLGVGFDVVFAEPDRLSPDRLASDMPSLDDEIRRRLAALPSNDARLADALRELPSIVGEAAIDNASPDLSQVPRAGFATTGPDPRRFVRRFPGLLRNVGPIEDAATGRGLFTIVAEGDGIVRRVPMVLAVGHRLVPSLSLEMLRVLTGAGVILVRSDESGLRSVALPGLEIPTDPHGDIWVHFGRHDPRMYYSIADILSGKVAGQDLAGKIVLVGTSATGLLDNKTTPVSRSMPGVEVHAQVLESIMDGALLHEPDDALALEILATLLMGGGLILIAPKLGPIPLLTVGGVAAVAVAGGSWWAFSHAGLLVDASFPLATSFVIYLTIVFANYARENGDRRRIRSAFGQYLAPALVEELCRSDETLSLGGTTRRMSVMFSDVRGFTAIAETFKDDPQGLTVLMNRLLTPLSQAIIDHRGTVDKYMGDAVMAFWNAPLDDAKHELNACRAALEMLQRLDALNAARRAEYIALADRSPLPWKTLEIGIGINTGLCVVGNMGSDLRFDYSVLGDAVNLASRLEGQSTTYGVPIIVGEATAHAVGSTFAVVELDHVQVKGKAEPEPIWAVVGDETVYRRAAFSEHAAHHAAMLTHYRARDLARAEIELAWCREGASTYKLETVYAIYAARFAALRQTGFAEGWTQVHVAASK